ncbi:sp110 nuclear body protein isoform X1 [Dasypus novemcinctus]|uniref:sp110 nuclear body protein isoform X1 n=1 Tax=Dasypus novemcinctus TaxID=9361 RepID=UPI00062A7653|nr:sp110 nuclear body protein isoform X1 [Dasypus novemcinctus]XP_012379527.1 sp110 nuclear body protein isoform X1 [Dasypus novemcinctus]XP_023443696.1 sp110 nuclear body protein isoform X1 [Dasypus novemcinctus]
MSTASRALEKALHQHFRYQKLEISYAIHKPFPFFEGLRDNSFITERTYLESLEACENLIPVSKVVYHLLTKLEETFDLSLLVTLFSQINLQEYPKLTTILRSFRSVGTSCGEGSRAKPVPSTTPADPAEGSSLQALLPLPPPQPPPPSPPPCARRCESEASAQQSKETLAGPRNPSDPAPALPGFIPKRRTVPVVRDDSPKPNAPEESQQAPNTSPNKKAAPQKKAPVGDQQTQMKEDSTYNSKIITRSQMARTEHTQTSKAKDSTDDGKKPSSQKSPEQRKKRTKNCNLSSSKKRQEKGLPRVSEKLEDETMDFQSPTLPVTCGEAKGILHKEKMKKGASEKCIQNKKGVWFTPKEFEREGNRAKAKNWKRSIRCRGKTLQHLLKKELLLCPPRINQKRKMFLEPSGSPLFEALFPVPANESLLRCA